MRAFVITGCVICAIAAFGLSLWTYMDVSMFGFPDGYVTDYQKAADTPLTVITWVSAGLGLVFLVLAFSPIGSRVRTIGWLTTLIALVLVAAAAKVGVPWYFGIHLRLDNGIGG
jgi:type IV secretory pathway TrbD component